MCVIGQHINIFNPDYCDLISKMCLVIVVTVSVHAFIAEKGNGQNTVPTMYIHMYIIHVHERKVGHWFSLHCLPAAVVG
jgi:hypothetical protein